MDLRVIGVLLLIPLLDVMLLVVLSGYIGFAPTVLIVVLTALLGMLLVRAEGRHTLGKIQRKLAQGEPPTNELVDGGFLLVAGALFLTPGIVTDAIALLFALPPTRLVFRKLAKTYVITPYVDAKTGGFASGNVYIGGFPGDRAGDGSGPGGFPGADAGGSDPGPDDDFDGETIDVEGTRVDDRSDNTSD
ncbi:FxsA family protein [Natronomonas sp. EA1]|uniref:FxsA family protein n=1 Tax=Natronomonas sp. EA1 TaxID=3421655 RepID=UPI003EBA976B